MKVKQRISQLLSAALLANALFAGMAIQAPAAKANAVVTPIFVDDYNTLGSREGLEAAGYIVKPNPATANNDVTVIPAADIANADQNNSKTGHVLYVKDSGSSKTEVVRKLSQPASGLLTLEFDWRSDSRPSDSNYRIMRVEDSANKPLVELRIRDSGANISHVIGSVNNKVVTNYEANKWYSFKIVVNTNTKTGQVFVKANPEDSYTSPGEFAFSDAEALAEVSRLQMYTSNGPTTSMYYDGLKMYSEVAATVTAPPENLQAVPGNSKVSLAWSPVAGASYTVKRSVTGDTYEAIASGLESNIYEDNTALNGTTYYYVVTATSGGVESAPSASAKATPAAPVVHAPPAVPSGLKAAAAEKQATVSWSAVPGAEGYKVKRSTDGASFTIIADAVVGTSYTDTGLTNQVTYHYVVTAYNTNGESDPSSVVQATPMQAASFDAYKLEGFAKGTTGGGMVPETDNAYIKVYTPTDFFEAINRKKNYKVIEIMNDLNLGYKELTAEEIKAGGNLIKEHALPLTHPVLKETGVTLIYLEKLNGVTIFSNNAAKIKHAGITIKGTNNLIIRNLEFDELWEWDENTKGDYDRNDWDFITITNASTNIWIDHCTFNKSYDGGVDVKAGSNNITISWSLFRGDDRSPGSWVTKQVEALEANPSAYPMYKFIRDQGLSTSDIIAIAAGQKKQHLVGANSLKADNADLELTLHHNYYSNMQDRMPRLRGGNVHVYNVVMDSEDNHAASKLMSQAQHDAIYGKGYKFGVTSNGAIATENGAVLVEKSHIIDIIYPIRNNQVDASKEVYTGKILALDTIYSLDGKEYRGNSDVEGNPLSPVPAPALAFSWNGMTELPYSYKLDEPDTLKGRLLAADGAGAGKLYWSESNWLRTSDYEGSAAPVEAPGAVEGLSATANEDGKIQLKWNALKGAAAYHVYRSTEAGNGYIQAGTVNGLSYTDSSVTGGTKYYYVVRGVNTAGSGAWSGEASATAVKVNMEAPAAPTGLKADGQDGKVSLSWSTVQGASSYKVWRSLTSGDGFAPLDDGLWTPQYTDNQVVNGTEYYYRVTAVNAGGESQPSAEVSAKPQKPANPTEGLELIVEDRFDDVATGITPEGYEVSEKAGAVRVAEVPSATDKSLFIEDTSASEYSQASRRFASQSKRVTVQVDFMQQTKANSAKVLRLLPATGSTPAVSIETVSGSLSYRAPGDAYTTLAPYNAGAWYTIQVAADLDAQTADIYVNGELKLQQAPFYAPLDTIAMVTSYTANSGTVGHYLNNLLVYGVAGEVVTKPAAVLTGSSTVKFGHEFDVQYGLQSIAVKDEDAFYAQEVTLSFNPEEVEYVSAASLKEGFQIIDVKHDAPGKIRIMAASLGKEGAIVKDTALLSLKWKAKTAEKSITAAIKVESVKLANSSGEQTLVSGTSFEIKLTYLEGDFNYDGVVDISDLGMVAAAYGMTSKDAGWSERSHMDTNGDGVIDIADLVFIAKRIP